MVWHQTALSINCKLNKEKKWKKKMLAAAASSITCKLNKEKVIMQGEMLAINSGIPDAVQ